MDETLNNQDPVEIISKNTPARTSDVMPGVIHLLPVGARPFFPGQAVPLLMEMEHWTRALRPNEPFCEHATMPDEAQGFGMIEAARGSLGHWLKVKKGRILNYQIVAPTTWNFSPRDAQGVAGALEQALLGASVRAGESNPVAVQHIVRSFDPCMVCTVH